MVKPKLELRLPRRAKPAKSSTHDLIVGIHAVEGVLNERAEDLLELFAQRGRDDVRMHTLTERCADLGLTVQYLERGRLDVMSDGARHQGVVARVRRAPELAIETVLSRQLEDAGDLLILDGVSDPHNLGACLRSAAAAGVKALIVARSRAAPMTPVTRRVACGGAELVPLCVVPNLARALKQIAEFGMPIVGLAGETDMSIYAVDAGQATALVIGTEATGLRRLTREHCDAVVQIPMPGRIESLNMSVAAGIALFEFQRQRLRS